MAKARTELVPIIARSLNSRTLEPILWNGFKIPFQSIFWFLFEYKISMTINYFFQTSLQCKHCFLEIGHWNISVVFISQFLSTTHLNVTQNIFKNPSPLQTRGKISLHVNYNISYCPLHHTKTLNKWKSCQL